MAGEKNRKRGPIEEEPLARDNVRSKRRGRRTEEVCDIEGEEGSDGEATALELNDERAETRENNSEETRTPAGEQQRDEVEKIDVLGMIRMQEMKHGNSIDWEDEKRKVKEFCRWKMFKMIKFPTDEMLQFSVFSKKMTEDERYNQYGIICRFALEEYGRGLRDPIEWWQNVRGVCMEAMRKKRSSVVEAMKKEYIARKCTMRYDRYFFFLKNLTFCNNSSYYLQERRRILRG